MTGARCMRWTLKKARCCGRHRSKRIRWLAYRRADAVPKPAVRGCRLERTERRRGNASYACCTFRGSVAALDIATGRVLWKTYLVNEEPRPYGKTPGGYSRIGSAGVPVLASPTVDIDRGLVYVATGSSYTAIEEPLADAVVAFALEDGKLRWAKQPPRQQGEAAEFDSSPILRTLASGKQVILAGPRSGVVYGLDPERGGEILWRSQAAEGEAATGGVEWGPAADHHSLYVALSGHAGAPEDRSGSLIALDLKTGAKRWQTHSADTCMHVGR